MEDHGPFTMAQLAARGVSHAQVTEHVAHGLLRRVGRLWLADAMASSEAIRAVAMGGRLGCLSACRHHGLWVPADPDLHVAINPRDALPPGPPPHVQFHRLRTPCPTPVLPLDQAIAQVLRNHDVETGLIVLESRLDAGRPLSGRFRVAFRSLTGRLLLLTVWSSARRGGPGAGPRTSAPRYHRDRDQ